MLNTGTDSFSSSFSAQANLAMSQGKPVTAPTAGGTDLRKTAEQFTGMFMSQMFQHMFEGVGKDAMFGGGPGEEMFHSVLIDEYGKAAAKRGGMGITDQIMHALIAQQEVKS
jgi:Rod binding domain-containing protein